MPRFQNSSDRIHCIHSKHVNAISSAKNIPIFSLHLFFLKNTFDAVQSAPISFESSEKWNPTCINPSRQTAFTSWKTGSVSSMLLFLFPSIPVSPEDTNFLDDDTVGCWMTECSAMSTWYPIDDKAPIWRTRLDEMVCMRVKVTIVKDARWNQDGWKVFSANARLGSRERCEPSRPTSQHLFGRMLADIGIHGWPNLSPP